MATEHRIFFLIRNNKQIIKIITLVYGYFRTTVWIYSEGLVANTTVDGAFDKSKC